MRPGSGVVSAEAVSTFEGDLICAAVLEMVKRVGRNREPGWLSCPGYDLLVTEGLLPG